MSIWVKTATGADKILAKPFVYPEGFAPFQYKTKKKPSGAKLIDVCQTFNSTRTTSFYSLCLCWFNPSTKTTYVDLWFDKDPTTTDYSCRWTFTNNYEPLGICGLFYDDTQLYENNPAIAVYHNSGYCCTTYCDYDISEEESWFGTEDDVLVPSTLKKLLPSNLGGYAGIVTYGDYSDVHMQFSNTFRGAFTGSFLLSSDIASTSFEGNLFLKNASGSTVSENYIVLGNENASGNPTAAICDSSKVYIFSDTSQSSQLLGMSMDQSANSILIYKDGTVSDIGKLYVSSNPDTPERYIPTTSVNNQISVNSVLTGVYKTTVSEQALISIDGGKSLHYIERGTLNNKKITDSSAINLSKIDHIIQSDNYGIILHDDKNAVIWKNKFLLV